MQKLVKEVLIPFKKTEDSKSDNFEAFGLKLFIIFLIFNFDY
jgi:hypothetical protein